MAQHLTEAIARLGGKSALARALKITRSAVSLWGDKVPVKHVLTIERLTGITRYQLRPDIYGKPPKEKGARPNHSVQRTHAAA